MGAVSWPPGTGRRPPKQRPGVAPRRCRVTWGLRAEGALSTMRSWTDPGDAAVIWHGAEETRNSETLAVQGSQGDRRRRAAGGWAGGAHRERAPEGHRASRFGHRRLSPQHRPHRWAGRPQHPGDDQEQDRAAGLSPRPGVSLLLQQFLELGEVGGHGRLVAVPFGWEAKARSAGLQASTLG